MEKLTAFIAIPVAKPTRARVETLSQHLQARMHEGVKRWIHPYDYHITLKFLGRIDDDSLREVDACLTEFVTTFNAFDIQIERPILFPSIRKPKVIACHVVRDRRLERMAEMLIRVLVPYGFAAESHPYRAHLTLARIDTKHPPRVPFVDQPRFPCPVDRIVLFESMPNAEVVHYREMREYILGTDKNHSRRG